MNAAVAADARDLFAAAQHCLDARDPDAKVALTHAYARRFPAGELPIANADGRALSRAVRARGKVDPVLVEHPRELRDALRADLPDEMRMDELSMGMSGDFELAIAEGATIVRVGQALFGARKLPDSHYWPEPRT